jgi:hypothetical protein
LSSTNAPANYCCFDALACIHALPNAVLPSTQEWNDVRTDVILAKNLKRLVSGWFAFMDEGIDTLSPYCHGDLD